LSAIIRGVSAKQRPKPTFRGFREASQILALPIGS